MKVSELIGADLDHWVAKAEGLDVRYCNDRSYVIVDKASYSPSTNWSQGGPLIERHLITITVQGYDHGPATLVGWKAVYAPYGVFEQGAPEIGKRYFHKSALVAAMRAYVAFVFGEEVPDESL